MSFDKVAEEVPVALVYNSVSHVVMLASPQNLQDFAGRVRDKADRAGSPAHAQG